MSGRRAFELFLRDRKYDARLDEPLGPMTTIRCGGPARYFIQPRTPGELSEVLAQARDGGIEHRLIGAGACLLVRDGGVDGAVLRLRHLRGCRIDGNLVDVGPGYDLPRLVKESIQRGLGGLEGLAGIPGTVGGSLVMNAGGRHGEIGDVVRHLDVMEPDGTTRRMSRSEVGFRYRGTDLDGRIILACRMELRPGDPAAIAARYDEVLAGKKATQPMGSLSAGCVFKNPPGGSAGRMIDACGLKGFRIGRAQVSRRHANFFINEGGCRSSDVLRLIDHVRERVLDRFGVELKLEITVW